MNIHVDVSDNPPVGKPGMRGVNIYGSDLQVTDALELISKLVPVVSFSLYVINLY